MSENKESEYNRSMDDFEIITPANGNDSSESTSLEQNESNNMDENNEAEMSAEDMSKDPESEDANPSNQESQWMEEKANFLASIEELNKSMTEKDEQLKELNSEHEQVVNYLKSQRVALEKAYEDVEKSNQRTAQSQDRIQELEKTIDDLQKKFNEKNHSVHTKRETQWIKEKEKILEDKEELEKRLKEKEKQLQDQETLQKKYKELETEKEELEAENTRVAEEIDDLKKKSRETDSKYQQDLDEVVRKRAVLQIACQELKAANDKLMAEKNRLQDDSHQTTAQSQAYIQKLQDEVIGLQKRLEETTAFYGSKLSEKQEALELVQVQLANITEQNDNANRQFGGLEAKNMEIQQGRAALEQELAKRNNLYTELSGINNEMEEQISKNKKTIRELKAALQEKTKKNEQQSEEILELRKANDTIKTQMGKFVNTTREVQDEKDRLEGELVSIKLEEKRLSEENTCHSRLVQELRNETIKLTEERDLYTEKCKDLEKGVKLNANIQISQLTKALEALNNENDVLKRKNKEFGRKLGELRSNNHEQEKKANVNRITVGKENGGYSSETSHEGETQQKSINLELMDTSTDESAAAAPPGADGKQWYDTDRGGQLFADIHRELNGKFVTIDISRAVTNKDISLVLTTDQSKKFTVNFPKYFPKAAVLVSCGRMTRQVKVPFSRDTSSKFVTEFTKKLCEIAFSEH